MFYPFPLHSYGGGGVGNGYAAREAIIAVTYLNKYTAMTPMIKDFQSTFGI
jgi:hypothetical protein